MLAAILPLRIKRRKLRPVKPETLARWWVRDLSNTPVEIEDGDEPPAIFGKSYGWETKTGIPISYPNAYAKKGWSSMSYRGSTRHIKVGREWLRERALAPYVSEAGACHLIPSSKRVIHGFEVWQAFINKQKGFLVKRGIFEFHFAAYSGVYDKAFKEAVKEAIKSLKKRRQEKLISSVKDGECWVTIQDSLKAGNCEPMTLNFAKELYSREGGEIGAIRGDRLREIRNDEYTRRAINMAKERICLKK